MGKGRKLTKEEAAAMGKKGGGHNKGKPSPNTLAKIEARAKLVEKIEADVDALYAAWRDSALGHFIMVKTETGMEKVYSKSPNPIAIKDMFERAFGKPDQTIGVRSEARTLEDLFDEDNQPDNADDTSTKDRGVTENPKQKEGDGAVPVEHRPAVLLESENASQPDLESSPEGADQDN